MKKIIFAFVLLIAPQFGSALPIGNPADPVLYPQGILCDECSFCGSRCSFRIGYYGDFVFNRHIERASGEDSGGDLEHSRIITNSGLLTVNFYERVDFFATLGATSVRIDSPSFSGPLLDHEYKSTFSWSIGARGIVWECGRVVIGAEGQYFAFYPYTTRLTFGADVSEFPSNAHAHVHEWQFGIGAAYRISWLVPYVGVKYSRLRFDNNDTLVLGTIIPDFKSANHFGFAVGATLVDCDIATLGIEGRFGDERALFVNGQIRF